MKIQFSRDEIKDMIETHVLEVMGIKFDRNTQEIDIYLSLGGYGEPAASFSIENKVAE